MKKILQLLFVSILVGAQSSFALPSPIEWLLPHKVQVPTIYYQGMTESQTQCAKYTGDRGFIATTGEHVVSNKSIDVIHTPYIGQEIDEVTPQLSFRELWRKSWKVTVLPTYLAYLLNQRRNKKNGITVTSMDNAQPNQTIMGHSIDLKKINIGQQGDVNNHHNKYEQLINEYGKDYPKILYGVSRGAATTFNAMATCNYENIQLVVLEGCFDSLDNLAPVRWAWLHKLGLLKLLFPLVEKFTSYKRSGMSPIGNVDRFPNDVPVLFISSKIDQQVPLVCTERLAKALANRGHQQVYFLSLNNSSHIGYMCDDEHDKALYQHVVHALYQKLRLPHVPELANQGKDILDNYRLSAS